MVSLVGSTVGRIRILSALGRGGMGEVYVGYDDTLDRRVALKAIRAEHRLDARAKARFLREARALSRLDHPNICRIHDYVEQAESDFLVLELIDGRSLEDAIGEGLARDAQLRVAEQIAGALAAAHAEGVVHRDLKPANVMLTDAGEVKVLDFGLAAPARDGPAAPRPASPETEAAASPASSLATAGDTPFFETGEDDGGALTRAGAVLGTPAYMSPEQARGEPPTTASDMYSLGLTLQTLFTGQRPYAPGLDASELLEQAARAQTLPVAGLPRDLQALLEGLKAPAAAARPTALEALARLRFIRDAPRRRLRRLAVAAVLVAAAFGALKYTLDLRRERAVAVAARQEAERRRSQAEDLVQFMLGDLRQRLEPVGRLDALDGVAAKALDYFASVPDEELSDDDRFRQAKALTQIGEVRTAQGDLAGARRSLEEAHPLARDLVARGPSNGDWLMGLGAIEFWLGNVDWLQGDLASAQARFEAYLDVAERLVRLDSARPEWRLELAYAHSNLGTLADARGDVAGALGHFRLTADAKRELRRQDPGAARWRLELADSLSWLGEALVANGDLAGAHEQYEAGRVLLAELVASEPENTRYRYQLGIAHNKVGATAESLGRLDEAERHFELSLTISRALEELDPANSDWRREVAVARQRLGLAVAQRDPAAGLRQLRRAVDSLARLHRTDAANSTWRLDLARARRDLGHGLLAAGAAAEALEEQRAALAMLGPVAEGRRRSVVEGTVRVAFGEAAGAAGLEAEARAAFRQVASALLPLAKDSRDPNVLAPLARALLQLGRADDARPVLERLRASGYRRWDLERARRGAVAD
jgi:serine/threonine-protein kinase